MSQKNKTIARRIIEEIFNRANTGNLRELVATEVVVHDTDKEIFGIDNVGVGIAALHTAFPDLRYTINDLLADNDKVIVRCTGTGTHAGPFRGIPPTGKTMKYTVIIIWRFANEKMVEHWSVSDVYGMLQQLDVVRLKS